MTTATVLTWLTTYGYVVAIPLVILNGPLVTVACGFLVRLGIFNGLAIYLLLVFADFFADMVWYYVGRYGARSFLARYGRFIHINMNHVERMERFFLQHGTRFILISKLTMGFGFPPATLTAAGAAKMPVRSYAFFNLVGGFIWTGALFAIGYFFGNAYTSVSQNARIAVLVLLTALLGGASYGFFRYAQRLTRTSDDADDEA